MKTRSKKLYCIGRRAGKSGPRLAVRKQTGIEKYTAGTNSSPEHPAGPQNREKPNLDPLDSPSPKEKKNQKEQNERLRNIKNL